MGTQTQTPQTPATVGLIQAQIRTILKIRQMTYLELGHRIGLSESGIKKIMRSKDLSLGRLDQICKALDLNLFDLMQNIEPSKLETAQFRPDQQTAFLNNITLFFFYWKLVFERCPCDTAIKELALTKDKAQKMLFELDRLDLIKVGPKDKLTLPRLRPVGNFGEGLLIRKIYHDWSCRLIEKLTSGKSEDSRQFFMFRGFSIHPETLKDLQNALGEIEKEFLNRGIRDMKIYPYKDLVPISWISGLIAQSFITLVAPPNQIITSPPTNN